MAEAFLGEIRVMACNFAPENWMLCQGQTLQVSQYEALYALIGAIYGGDGSRSFMLPDLRGRVAVGQGQGTGLTSRTVGQYIGADTAPCSAANMPAHTHGFQAASKASQSTNVPTAAMLGPVASDQRFYVPANAGTPVALDATAISSTGTSSQTSIPIVAPMLALSYMFCIQGLFPERP
ncbi:phage tail protein [Ferrovibrio sp.]|uniref:phage tail protein n=1 Tax=Ferrovibrio sp. TaxID=1917215 RepID=UPI003D2DE415